MAGSITQPLIFLLPRVQAARAFAKGKGRVSWGSPTPRTGLCGAEPGDSGGGTGRGAWGGGGGSLGVVLSPLRSPGSVPVESGRAARYLLMEGGDSVQRCSRLRLAERRVPFFGAAASWDRRRGDPCREDVGALWGREMPGSWPCEPASLLPPPPLAAIWTTSSFCTVSTN